MFSVSGLARKSFTFCVKALGTQPFLRSIFQMDTQQLAVGGSRRSTWNSSKQHHVAIPRRKFKGTCEFTKSCIMSFMSKSIPQGMAYRQSLMKCTEKYGSSRISRKYSKSRSYICFCKKRWDGTPESLACQSRRPHSPPKQHTEPDLKLSRDMCRRNPRLSMVGLRQRGYTRRPNSFPTFPLLWLSPNEFTTQYI